MTTKFITAATKLMRIREQFDCGAINAVESNRARETALADSLKYFAAEYAVALEYPLRINGQGEFRIVARRSVGQPSSFGAVPFGENFSTILSRHRPRTETVAGAHSLSENVACYMSHFDVEALVREQMAARLHL